MVTASLPKLITPIWILLITPCKGKILCFRIPEILIRSRNRRPIPVNSGNRTPFFARFPLVTGTESQFFMVPDFNGNLFVIPLLEENCVWNIFVIPMQNGNHLAIPQPDGNRLLVPLILGTVSSNFWGIITIDKITHFRWSFHVIEENNVHYLLR